MAGEFNASEFNAGGLNPAELSAAEGYGHSPRLTEALTVLWSQMADRYGLIPELAFDAVMSRARAGDIADTKRCLPRLVNMMVDYELSIAESIEVIEFLTDEPWTDEHRDLLVETLDAWWFEVLQRNHGEHPPAYTPDAVLGLLSRTGARMVRWLHVWMAEFDGPASSHLANALVDGLDGPAWEDQIDERAQVVAWARSETVVNGLAVVGATHIDPDIMSSVLDVLLDS